VTQAALRQAGSHHDSDPRAGPDSDDDRDGPMIVVISGHDYPSKENTSMLSQWPQKRLGVLFLSTAFAQLEIFEFKKN
jgi:hypothetical protein